MSQIGVPVPGEGSACSGSLLPAPSDGGRGTLVSPSSNKGLDPVTRAPAMWPHLTSITP